MCPVRHAFVWVAWGSDCEEDSKSSGLGSDEWMVVGKVVLVCAESNSPGPDPGQSQSTASCMGGCEKEQERGE